jgi:TorA maturation chaperone TorD
MEPNQLALLAQADLLFLLAGGFASPRDNLDWQLRGVSRQDVVELATRTQLPESAEIAAAMADWLSALQATTQAVHSREYHRLFEAAIFCPLNETAYVRRDKGIIIGDLCGFYRAFGWRPRAGLGEKPDHIAHELQFAGVLLAMLAQAQHAGQPERSETALAALRKFGADHLGDWLPAAIENLREKSNDLAFQGLAAALHVVWTSLVGALAIPVTPPELSAEVVAIPTLEDETAQSPYEPCGFESAPGLVSLGSTRRESPRVEPPGETT